MFASMEKELCYGFYDTEPLWTKTQFGVEQFNFPKISFEKLQAQPIPERIRLGHKMEHVFEQLIGHCSDWDVVAKNLLIDRNKERLGELDFIIHNRLGNEKYHIELAYKYYIINPEITEPIHRLMGPNKRDMFFTKLEKLKNKQFPLLFSDELKMQLQELAVETKIVKQQVCFKTQLFVPYQKKHVSIRPLNKNCIVGSWIHFDDFNTPEFKNHEYYIPYKQEWVIAPQPNRAYNTHYETLLDINLRMLKENAPMLWVRKPDETIEKLFVVWW